MVDGVDETGRLGAAIYNRAGYDIALFPVDCGMIAGGGQLCDPVEGSRRNTADGGAFILVQGNGSAALDGAVIGIGTTPPAEVHSRVRPLSMTTRLNSEEFWAGES